MDGKIGGGAVCMPAHRIQEPDITLSLQISGFGPQNAPHLNTYLTRAFFSAGDQHLAPPPPGLPPTSVGPPISLAGRFPFPAGLPMPQPPVGPPPPPQPQRGLPSPVAAPTVSPGADDKGIAAKEEPAAAEVKAALPLPFPGLGGLDLPGEAGAQMSKLYQDELAKIMQQQQKALAAAAPAAATAPPAGLFPGLGPLGSLFGRPDANPEGPGAPPGGPELQRAMDIYHQELNRLQQGALAAAFKSAQNGKDQESDKTGSDLKENGADTKPPTSLSSQSSPSSAGRIYPHLIVIVHLPFA